MESDTLLQKLNESNLNDLERLQAEYEDQEADEINQTEGEEEGLRLAELFDLEEIFLEAEKLGNETLKGVHEDLGFHDRIINIHARGTARVLKKNFKILQQIEENPEASLGALTALMALSQIRTFKKLQAAGEISRKVSEDEA